MMFPVKPRSLFFSLSAFILIMSVVVFQTACKNNKPDNNAANPFSSFNYEAQKLSDTDKIQLANAAGKTLIPISSDTLVDRIKKSTDKLHLYCFWKLNNASSVEMVKVLKKISEKYTAKKLKIIFVTMPSSNVSVADYNLFIREQQITDNTLVLKNGDVSFFSIKLKKDFSGITGFPVILLVNNSDNILQLYNKSFDENELTALIEPLM